MEKQQLKDAFESFSKTMQALLEKDDISNQEIRQTVERFTRQAGVDTRKSLTDAARSFIDEKLNSYPEEIIKQLVDASAHGEYEDVWTLLKVPREGDYVFVEKGVKLGENGNEFDMTNTDDNEEMFEEAAETVRENGTVQAAYQAYRQATVWYLVETNDGSVYLATNGTVDFVNEDDNSLLPMFGWLYSVPDEIEAEWLRQNTLEASRIGLHVIESEAYGVFIGINGVGYSFMEAHWIPYYLVRGYKWHNKEEMTPEEKELSERWTEKGVCFTDEFDTSIVC